MGNFRIKGTACAPHPSDQPPILNLLAVQDPSDDLMKIWTLSRQNELTQKFRNPKLKLAPAEIMEQTGQKKTQDLATVSNTNQEHPIPSFT